MAKAEHPNVENVGATVEPVAADAVRAGGSNSPSWREQIAEALELLEVADTYACDGAYLTAAARAEAAAKLFRAGHEARNALFSGEA